MSHFSRRNFLAGAGALSTAAMIPVFARPAQSASCKLPPFVITVHAGGGWDPTFFCDPVVDDERFTPFSSAEVRKVGDLSYLPFKTADEGGELYEYNGQDFFQKHFERMVVLNGVDNATVSHGVGKRLAHTGSIREGYPSLSALVAGLAGPTLPLAFLASNSPTEGLVPLAPVGGKLFDVLNTNSTRTGKEYFDEKVYSVIQNARWEHDAARLASEQLPLKRLSLKQITMGRNSANEDLFAGFAGGAENFKPEFKNDFADAGGAVLAAMNEGLCAAGHLNADGAAFDTHSGHDSLSNNGPAHRVSLRKVFEGLDFIIERAEATESIMSRGLVIHVASEFGRTTYNDTNGKDHWPITSNFVIGLGAAADKIGGGRVIGSSKIPEGDGPKGVITQTLRVDGKKLVPTEEDDPDGFRLGPGQIHVALRKALELCDEDDPERPLERYEVPLVDPEPLPLFGV